MKKHLRPQTNPPTSQSTNFPTSQLPNLPLILAPLILFAPVLFTGRALFWGTPALQFAPWWDFAWKTLRAGHLPLWNPLAGMGAPLIANYQSALFYPPHWLYFFLHLLGGVPLMAWGMALLVVLHLMWAGLGMAALTRKLGFGRLAQTVAGLAFSLSGYLVARAGFLSINAAAAWLPWVLLFALDVAAPQSTKRLPKSVGDFENLFRVTKLGVVIGLQFLAGHAQTSWYTLVLAGIWIAFWAWTRSGNSETFSRLGRVLQGWARYAGAGLIALGLAAVQLFPTAEYLLQSQRSAAVDYELAMTYSFWPWRFLTLLAPNMFGNPARGNYWGYANFWEDAVYIGLLPLLLAFAAIFAIRKRRSPLPALHSRLTCYSLLIAFISFLLALGKNTPIFPWLYRHIPTFDMFQAPTRITLWAVFALSLLAAVGVEHWRRPQKRALYWTRLGTAGAFAVSLGAGLAWHFMDDIRLTFIRALAMAGLWALGTGALALTAPPRGENTDRRWWRWGVVLWVMADLLVAGWGLNPGVSLDFYRPREGASEGRVYLPAADEYQLKFDRFLQFETYFPQEDWSDMRSVRLPNLNMLDGVPMVNNFDPFVPGRYQQWMETFGEVEPAPWAGMLNLMDVTTIEHVSSTGGLGVLFTPWTGGQSLRWVGCANYVESGEEALDAIANGEIDLSQMITLEGRSLPAPTDCSAGEGKVRLEDRLSPNEIMLHVNANLPGWVLWSEVWYPGWRAWVDGQPVSVERGDYLFQAIPVPEGQHVVVAAYRPVWFYAGGAVSLLTLMGVVFFFWRRKEHSVE